MTTSHLGNNLHDLGSLLEKSEQYVVPDKRQEFERELGLVLDTLVEGFLRDRFERELGDLLAKTDEYILPERKREFELRVQSVAIRAQINMIEELAKEAYTRSGEGWARIQKRWHELRGKAEASKRRLGLLKPDSSDNFEAALMWMAENGEEEDLELIRELRKNRTTSSAEILRLLRIAEQRIAERMDDPYRVLNRGEEAYQKNKNEWDHKYAGQFIAIYRGEVIDSDADKAKLIGRIMQNQKKTGPFRAYVVAVGAPTVTARAPLNLRPRRLPRISQQPDRESKRPERGDDENDT